MRAIGAHLTTWAWMPVPLLLAAVVWLRLTNAHAVYESATLLTVLNFTFATTISVFITILASITVIVSRSASALFIGGGALVMGMSFMAAALAGRTSPNVIATVHNLGMLVAGALNLVGAWFSFRPRRPVAAPAAALSAVYLPGLALVLVVTALAAEDLTPAFFLQGAGGTPVRQAVLAAAVALFGAAGALLLASRQAARTFGRWYGLGLVLLAVGLIAVMVQPSLGSLVGWVGRSAQYLGGAYLLVAVASVVLADHRWSMPLQTALDDAVADARESRSARDEALRLAEDLHRSEARLRVYFESPAIGIAVTTPATRFLEVNDRFCSMMGRSREELSGMTWRDLSHPDELQVGQANVQALAAGESAGLSRDKRYIRKDGTVFWASVSVTPVRDAHGAPVYLVALLTDITKRKEAEEALARSEARQRLLMRMSPSAIFLYRRGVIEYANEAGAALLGGRSPEDVVGRSLLDFVSADARADISSRIAIAPAEGSVRRTRVRLVRLDGASRMVDIVASLAPEGPGGVVQAVATDVTEMLEAGEALKESEARYARVLEVTQDGFWDSNFLTGKTLHSARMNEIVGLPAVAREFETGDWRRRVHPDDMQALLPTSERMLAGRQDRVDAQYRVRCEDGSWKWVRMRARLVERDDSGRPTRMVGAVSDITDGKVGALRLAASEARFKALAGLAPVGIFETDLDGNPTYLNAMAAKMLRLPPEGALGTGWVAAIHPEDRDAFVLEWRTAVSGKRPFNREFRVRRPDGSTSIHLASVAPVEGPGGTVAGLIGAMIDITELRAVQEQLQVASRLAALGTLVAGVAHEINNPLVGVTAGLGVAVEDLRDLRGKARQGGGVDAADLCHHMDEVLDGLEDATVGARRIAAIVKDLTAFGRSDQRKSRVSLPEVLQDAMRWLPSGSREFVTIDIDSREVPFVVASAPQLAQVVINLVTNAVKSIPVGRKGSVRVHVGPCEAGKVCLTVEDDGAGMTPEVMKRMFDPFFTTREVGKGTGLGLAVTHAIVTEHGGTIRATSEVGKGSTFTVELAAAPVEG